MRRDPSPLRQRIRGLEEALARPLQEILAERGPLRRGSFVTLHRKCGKPTCHCARGEGHPADYLSVPQEGRKRLLYVSAQNRDQIAREAERYRRFRRQRAILARLMRTLLQRIDELGEALENREPIPGRRRLGKSS